MLQKNMDKIANFMPKPIFDENNPKIAIMDQECMLA